MLDTPHDPAMMVYLDPPMMMIKYIRMYRVSYLGNYDFRCEIFGEPQGVMLTNYTNTVSNNIISNSLHNIAITYMYVFDLCC